MRISDWSSDVCSSDLRQVVRAYAVLGERQQRLGYQLRAEERAADADVHHVGDGLVAEAAPQVVVDADRKSVVSGKSVSVRVDLGGRRLIKKIKKGQSKRTV